MGFAAGEGPQAEAFMGGEENIILDSMDTPVGPVVLYVYKDAFERGPTWIGIGGPDGSHLSGAGQVGRDPPLVDESVTMNLDVWGGVVWGNVSDKVALAELRTVEGATFPAKLIPLPKSLDAVGQAVWGLVDGATADRVTTLLYDAHGNVLNDYYPTGPRVAIGTGEDPLGGPWELHLEPTNEGTGLGFRFATSGGGSGCCLQPLKEDFRLDGWGSGGSGPSHITALASDTITRVAFAASSGVQIEGSLHPVPDETLGIHQVALIIVPSAIPLEGDLVGYSADGTELGRAFVGAWENP